MLVFTKNRLRITHDLYILKTYDFKGDIMVVTATQFKSNIGHYLDTISEDDVYITKNGKMVAKLSDPRKDRMSILNALVGILPSNHISLEDAKMERILKKAFPGEDPYVVNKRLEERKKMSELNPYDN